MVKYAQLYQKFMDVSGVVMTIVSVTIGVILIGSLMIPQVTSVMSSLQADHPDWADLLGVVVICSIIGLIAVALYAFKSKN